MTNGKAPAPGNVMRAMADNIAKQALAIAEGTEDRIKSIQDEANRSVAQLNEALERFQQNSRDGAAKLAEAVQDQFGMLAQRIDDLTAHCNNASQAFAEHHNNIVNGLAALKEEAPPVARLEKLPGLADIPGDPHAGRAIPRMPAPGEPRGGRGQ